MADDAAARFLELRRDVERRREAHARALGQLDSDLARLRREFGVGSEAEAREALSGLEARCADLRAALEEALGEIERRWPG